MFGPNAGMIGNFGSRTSPPLSPKRSGLTTPLGRSMMLSSAVFAAADLLMRFRSLQRQDSLKALEKLPRRYGMTSSSR